MTPEQKQKARHALGLPNDRRQSYRNRFFVSVGSPDDALWKGLSDADDADYITVNRGTFREAVKTEAEVWMAVSAWTGMTLDDVADILPDTVRRFGELTGTVKCNGHVYLIDEGRLVTVLPRGGTARRLHQRGR